MQKEIEQLTEVQPDYFNKTLIAEYVGSHGDTLSNEDKDELYRNIVGYFESFHTKTSTYKLPLHESVEAMGVQPGMSEENNVVNDSELENYTRWLIQHKNTEYITVDDNVEKAWIKEYRDAKKLGWLSISNPGAIEPKGE